MNKLVQITLKADQEKYNLDGDASITVVDANSYYIGRIITQHHGWITFESVDQGGNLGGIVFIKEDQVAKIEDDTPNLRYYMITQVKDSFNLEQLNKTVLAWDFTNLHDLLINVADAQPFTTFEVNTGATYTGLITQLDQQEVRILERNELTLEHYATVIPLDDIVCVDTNAIDNRLFTQYLRQSQKQEFTNDLDMVEIYFDYTFDDQYGSFGIGKVLKDDDDNLVFESINELGQVESIAVIARSHITHITEDSERLLFFNFLVQWQKNNGSFDPDRLERSVKLRDEIQSPAEIIDNWPEDQIVKISDSIYHYPDRLGLIEDRSDSGFDLKIVTEYGLGDTSVHDYSDLISVDLAGSEMIKMQQFIDNEG